VSDSIGRCDKCINYKRISRTRGVCMLISLRVEEDFGMIDSRVNEALDKRKPRTVVPSFATCDQFIEDETKVFSP